MSLKSIRTLALVAMILRAAALVAQMAILVINWRVALLRVLFELAPFAVCLIYMIHTRRLRTDRASRTSVIVLTILTGVLSLGGNLLGDTLTGALVNQAIRSGLMSGYELARISTINSLTSTLLSIPALILMSLSMGGFCNRAGRLNAVATGQQTERGD